MNAISHLQILIQVVRLISSLSLSYNSSSSSQRADSRRLTVTSKGRRRREDGKDFLKNLELETETRQFTKHHVNRLVSQIGLYALNILQHTI